MNGGWTNALLFVLVVAVAFKIYASFMERRILKELRRDMRITSLIVRCWASDLQLPPRELQEKLTNLLEREGLVNHRARG